MRSAAPYDLLSLTTWQMVWGSVALAPFALVLPVHVRWTPSFVAAVAFLVVFAAAVGWALWLFILSRLSASVAGIASLATPVVGVTIAALQLHEVPSAMGCIVAALVS
jgi:drug/metabolite transporter (DMT)-like permease